MPRLITLIVLVMLILTPVGAGSSAPAQPGRGGTLTWGLHVALDRLDPPASIALATGMVVGRNIFDRLVEHDEKLNIGPGLATQWSVSPDSLTWTFRLRRGVRFHDGTPFTADAVVFNVQRDLDPQLHLPAGAFAWGGVKGVRKVDDYTVQVFSDRPLASLLNNIADSGFGAIVSPGAVRAAKDPRDFVPVGTGAFRFVSWAPDGDLVLEANKDYWRGAPRIDRLVVRVSPVASTRVNQLEAGEVDLITQVPIFEIARLKSVRGIEIGLRPSTSWTYIAMNTLRPPFDNLSVRHAINYLVDKKTIVDKVLFGVGRAADSPIGSAYKEHESVKVYPYDPGLGKRLLDAAGWLPGRDGIRVKSGRRLAATLWVPAGRFPGGIEMAQTVASYLRGAGIEVTVQEVEFAFYLAELRKGSKESTMEMAMLGWGTADPDTGLRLVLHSQDWPPQGNNVAFYKNATVDDLLDRAASTMNPDARTRLYHRVQEIVMEDAPWLFLTERREAVAWRSYVTGVRFIPSSAGLIDVRQVSVAK